MYLLPDKVHLLPEDGFFLQQAPGCSLVSFHILCDILQTFTVSTPWDGMSHTGNGGSSKSAFSPPYPESMIHHCKENIVSASQLLELGRGREEDTLSSLTGSYTGPERRMPHRKWREIKQYPSRAGLGYQLVCCLVSLYFLCNILQSSQVLVLEKGLYFVIFGL